METFRRILKDRQIRGRILAMMGLLALFRVAAVLPIPGIDTTQLKALFASNQVLGFLNLFTGGALDNLSIVMLGVGPYITGSIIMQLLTMIFPNLKQAYFEEGEIGRKKFQRLSRYLTLPLAFLQGFALLTILARQGIIAQPTVMVLAVNVLIVAAGSIFLMWIGELMTQYGIGNGVSMIIFAGIVSAIPSTVRQVALSTISAAQIPVIIGFVLASVVIIAGVVYVTEAERPIPVSYAKRVRGGKLYGGLATYLPLRVNQAGVIPIIFALSILIFPQVILTFIANSASVSVASTAASIQTWLNSLWVRGGMYFVLVFLFTYFYTSVTFDPKSISENLQKSGGFIPGMRPGNPTAEYLAYVISRITLFGGFFLGIIAVLPILMEGLTGNQALTIGGTALLIVVSVVLETMRQVSAQLTIREYD